MMLTVCLKLDVTEEQSNALLQTQIAFSEACNKIVPDVVKNRCWNRKDLHHECYYRVREELPQLGAQMVCNAIAKVCASYKARGYKKSEKVIPHTFNKDRSVHYDARTFTLKENQLSLFSVNKRVRCGFKVGAHPGRYLKQGKVKEAELVRKGTNWFFHVVIELPDPPLIPTGDNLGVDIGENNLATTSKGTIHGGGQLRHEREKFKSRHAKLQSNGSRSARRCRRRISGKEHRRVTDKNHVVSKAIIEEALRNGVKCIILEDLTNIRERIRMGKRMRARLHSWAFRQLREFIEYKAKAAGIQVIYVNPAYTSQTCSQCGALGSRDKHCFTCSTCKSYQHSDRNAAINLRKLGDTVVSSMVPVSVPQVAGGLPLATNSRL
jgi:putative transposase